MIEIEVFIDESGQFVETSSDSADQELAKGQRRSFASQLAGLLFVKGAFDEAAAESVIMKCCKKSKVEFTHLLHCNEISPQEKFSDFLAEGCSQFQQKKLQPFRIVNEEQVSYGDRVSNYTNILAELLVRICHECAKLGQERISLTVNAARVWLGEDDSGERKFIAAEDYLSRINEYFVRAAIRKGYGAQTKNWSVRSFRLASGRDHKVLQLCDLVSNASHDRFLKCNDITESRLRSLLGEFDFTLSSDAFYEQVNEYVAESSFGLAFVTMTQRAVDVTTSSEDTLFKAKLDGVARRFSQLSASGKLPQLRILIAWLQQSIETRADLKFSLDSANWIRSSLVGAISRQANSEEQLATWLNFVTTSLIITAENHLGQTIEADRESKQLDELIPKLAGRWEYSPDIFEALIARAVHQNDCFETETARQGMDAVAGFFSNLTGFFNDAFPGMFPDAVKSDLWAKALGTKVQSETFLLLQSKCSVEQARKTSDAAIQQFSLTDDKNRQYQFRSEIEAVGGHWDSARGFLAMSLGLEDSSHDAIAAHISGLELSRQGFPLLHWTRLGGMAAATNDRDELAAFNSAFKSHKFATNQWVIGTASEHYPTHGILRRVAVVKAFNGDKTGANAAISRLRNIISSAPTKNPVFEAILAAALLQVAAVVFRHESGEGIEYLDHKNREKQGAKQIVKELARHSNPMAILFEGWESTISSCLNGEFAREELARLGSRIGY